MNLNSLRIALVAGQLGMGGAEKQLVYMARSLHEANGRVQVYCLTRDEYYEAELKKMGIPVYWFGKNDNPVFRAISLYSQLKHFQPQIVHSSNFFTNLYAVIAARLVRAVEVGAVRSSVDVALQDMKGWGPLSLRAPKHLIVNSLMTQQNTISLGISKDRVSYLSNVIDVEDFDRQFEMKSKRSDPQRMKAILVANCYSVKRIDRFLDALALAKKDYPQLSGWIVGDGPERAALEKQACLLCLEDKKDINFLGKRTDIATILQQGDVLCLTSESEGSPNVLLEGMAAGLPIIAFDSGNAKEVVLHERTGFIVNEGVAQMASFLIELAKDVNKRLEFGNAGRCRVETHYSYPTLLQKLLDIYLRTSRQQRAPDKVVDCLLAT